MLSKEGFRRKLVHKRDLEKNGWEAGRRERAVKPVILSIRQQETGERIRRMMEACGYTVKDIQSACSFMNPQAVYRWLRGDALPSVENLLILSRVLRTDIESLLVIEEQSTEAPWMGRLRTGEQRTEEQVILLGEFSGSLQGDSGGQTEEDFEIAC